MSAALLARIEEVAKAVRQLPDWKKGGPNRRNADGSPVRCSDAYGDPDFVSTVRVKHKGPEAEAAPSRQVGGDHYAGKKVQPWDAMEAWMNPEQFKGFLRGNAIKYLARCDDKGGLEDLKKAQHYLDKLIEVASSRL